MRKFIVFIQLLTGSILITGQVYSQKAFLNAQSIEKMLSLPANSTGNDQIRLKDTADLYPILQQYVAADEAGDHIKIQAAFANNPFMSFGTVESAVRLGFKPYSILAGSSLGGLDVTSIANGVAALMVERAKQELTIVFFNRFKQFTKSHREIAILFPVTTANLDKLLTYAYPQMLPVLRNGFFADLKQLPVNLPSILDLPKYQNLLANVPELRMAIRSMRLVSEMQSGASTPADVLVEIAGFPEWDDGGTQAYKNVGSTIKLAALFSQSLRSADDNEVWLSPKEIKDLTTDITLTNLYLGLLWEGARTGKILFYTDPKDLKNTVALTVLLAGLKSNTQPIIDRVTKFISLAGQVNTAIRTIRINNAAGRANSDADYYNYIGAAIDAIDSAFGLVRIFDRQLNVEPYFAVARSADAIYKDIYSHQYTQAVSDVLDVCSGIHALVDADDNPKLITVNASMPGRDDALKEFSALAEKLKPYALFMANIVEAKSSADVTAALDNAILPVGSSSIKKNSSFNVSVQSYLGAFYTFSSQNTGTSIGTWSDKFGVTAPIGVSLTPGFLSRGKYGSGSLFLALFDLGAIVDYQLKSDTSVNSSGATTTGLSKNYSVKLGQIVSPGVYFVYGFFGNLPLALGIGGQYGPGLSRIDAGATPVLNAPRWRGCLFLTVDLPFFTLVNHTKPGN